MNGNYPILNSTLLPSGNSGLVNFEHARSATQRRVETQIKPRRGNRDGNQLFRGVVLIGCWNGWIRGSDVGLLLDLDSRG